MKKSIIVFKMFFLYLFLIGLSSCSTNSNKPDFNLSEKATTLSSLGDVYAQSGQLADAEHYYDRAQAIEPKKSDVLLKLADVQVQQGELTEAKSTYQKILVNSPKNTHVRQRLASIAISDGDFATALTQYKTLLGENNKNYRAINGVGVMLDHLAKFNNAQVCYKKGLSYVPKDFSLLNNLGISYALSGDINKAKYYLQLSSQFTTTTRPRENMVMIDKYYKKTNNSVKRQLELSNALLIKKNNINSSIVGDLLIVAKQWC